VSEFVYYHFPIIAENEAIEMLEDTYPVEVISRAYDQWTETYGFRSRTFYLT